MKKLLAVSLCLSAVVTACSSNTVPSAPVVSASAQNQNQSLRNLQPVSQQPALALNQRVQASLASYHDIDASFADAEHLANTPNFKTQLLGIDIIEDVLDDDDDQNDGDDKDNHQASDGLLGSVVDVVTDTVDEVTDVVDEVADTVDDVSDRINSSSQGSSQSSNQTSSQAALNQAPVQTPMAAASGQPAVNVNNATTAALSAQALVQSFDQSAYDRKQLQAELQSRLQTEAMRRQIVAEDAPAWQSVSADQLQRLKGRGIQSVMTRSASRNNADGTVLTRFGVRFKLVGSEREVWVSSLTRDDVRLESSSVFKEQGSGWLREAARRAEMDDKGLLRTMTVAKTRFSSQDELEVLEDRYTGADGSGIGRGSFVLGGQSGDQGELRTKIEADGSISSFLNAGSSPDLVLREDSLGQISFSTRQPGAEWNNNWQQLELTTMLAGLFRTY